MAASAVLLAQPYVQVELAAAALHETVLGALRHRLDAAFLPRRIVAVPSLPREPTTGKLPAQQFAAWAEQALAASKG